MKLAAVGMIALFSLGFLARFIGRALDHVPPLSQKAVKAIRALREVRDELRKLREGPTASARKSLSKSG